jgi:hypothetical protein
MKKRDSKTTDKKEEQEQTTETPNYSRRKALSQGLTVLSAYALTGLLPTETRAELSTGANRLVLQERDLSKQVNDLFAEIKRDKQKEREFVDNPVGVLGARLSPREFQGLSRQRVANANRTLYALLANDQFLNWLRTYQKGLGTGQVNKGKVLRDFAGAMARYGDPEFFQGMLEEEEAQYVSPLDIRSNDRSIAVVYDKFIAVHGAAIIVWHGNEFINPAEMRALTDLLVEKAVSKAKQQKAAGELQKQIVEIQ